MSLTDVMITADVPLPPTPLITVTKRVKCPVGLRPFPIKSRERMKNIAVRILPLPKGRARSYTTLLIRWHYADARQEAHGIIHKDVQSTSLIQETVARTNLRKTWTLDNSDRSFRMNRNLTQTQVGIERSQPSWAMEKLGGCLLLAAAAGTIYSLLAVQQVELLVYIDGVVLMPLARGLQYLRNLAQQDGHGAPRHVQLERLRQRVLRHFPQQRLAVGGQGPNSAHERHQQSPLLAAVARRSGDDAFDGHVGRDICRQAHDMQVVVVQLHSFGVAEAHQPSDLGRDAHADRDGLALQKRLEPVLP
eukprot:6180692-Pleurochrysis_carterae.AAC.4